MSLVFRSVPRPLCTLPVPFAVAAALVLCNAVSAPAGLCPACQDRSYTKDIGECKECGGLTTSGQFQLCLKCSAKLRLCEHCRKEIPAAPAAQGPGRIALRSNGVYKAGPWEYRYTVGNPGSRSEGYFGELLFSGKPVPAAERVNDFYQTPFGPLYWVGQPSVLFGGHGWMPKPLARAKPGKPLPGPAAATE